MTDSPASSSSSAHTYEERAAMRREKREQARSGKGTSEDDTSGLTYQERAAMRRAERERKRQERAELAGSQ